MVSTQRLIRAAASAALFCLCPALAPGEGLLAQGSRMLAEPTVSANEIAFVHANDIWVVGRDGGIARRLTSGAGAETSPHFSPDGRWIAFTGEYDGNDDVYVVPAEGGQPQAADLASGRRRRPWGGPRMDPKVLFQSGREGYPTATTKFFTVPLDGGLPEALADSPGRRGRHLGRRPLRRLPGGRLLGSRVEELPGRPGAAHLRGQPGHLRAGDAALGGERQMSPVWMDGVVYYISERDWAANVWSWDPRTGEERQLTHHADFDVKSLGAGDGVRGL